MLHVYDDDDDDDDDDDWGDAIVDFGVSGIVVDTAKMM